MKKRILLIVPVLLAMSALLVHLFRTDAIGFELPAATEPEAQDLIAIYQDVLPQDAQVLQISDDPVQTQPTDAAVSEEKAAPRLQGKLFFVYDCRENEFTAINGSETTKLYMGSITKMMNAYVALQYLELDEIITVGREVWTPPPNSSRCGIYPGCKLTVRDCLVGLLLPSGCDAAYTLAVTTGRRIAGDESLSVEAAVRVFVKEMNAQAEKLQLVNTHYVTPDGNHDVNHYTCPIDLVTLSRALTAYPVVMEIVQSPSMQVNVNGSTLTWVTTNYLVDEGSKYYQPYAVGLKTGYTSIAGGCMIGMFFKDDRIYITGIFGSSYYGRMPDSKAIYRTYIED